MSETENSSKIASAAVAVVDRLSPLLGDRKEGNISSLKTNNPPKFGFGNIPKTAKKPAAKKPAAKKSGGKRRKSRKKRKRKRKTKRKKGKGKKKSRKKRKSRKRRR
jgi:hypothetical protein